MPAKYRYTFNGSTILNDEPLNWDNLTVNFKRSADLGGITKSFTQDLEFWGDGNDFIRNIYETEGINGIVTVLVELYNFDTYAYEDFFTGKINFTNYSEVQDAEGLNFVITNIESTGFEQDFINGIDVPINVYGLATRKGAVITPFPNWEVVPANISGQVINKVINGGVKEPATTNSDMIGRTSAEIMQPNKFRIDIAQTKGGNDTIDWRPTKGDIRSNVPVEVDSPLLITPRYRGDMNISGNIIFDINITTTTSTINSVNVVMKYLVSKLPTLPEVGFEFFNQNFPSGAATFSQQISTGFNGDIEITPTNNNVVMECEVTVTGNGTLTYSVFNVVTTAYNMDVVQQSWVTSSIINGQLPFEMFTRMVNFLTEQPDRVQGDAISRTNQHVFPAASDGVASKMLAATGLSVRTYPIAESPLASTIRDLFNSLNYGFNLGIGVVPIGGVDYVVIDDIEVFYDSATVILRIDKSVRNVKRTVMTDEYFGSITVGFTKYQIEDRNFQNTQEFNTQRSYVSGANNIANIKSILSPYIGAGYGIEYQRRNKYFVPANGNSPDGNRFDDDIFMISCIYDAENTRYIKETPDDFFGAQVVVSNLENPDSSFNMRISPRQAMERHKKTNNAVDWRIDQDVLKFSGEKIGNIEMSTTSPDFAENEDVSTTAGSIFENEMLEFEMDWGLTETKALDANRYGVIALTTPEITFTGFVQEVSHNVEEGVATVTLRRAANFVSGAGVTNFTASVVADQNYWVDLSWDYDIESPTPTYHLEQRVLPSEDFVNTSPSQTTNKFLQIQGLAADSTTEFRIIVEAGGFFTAYSFVQFVTPVLTLYTDLIATNVPDSKFVSLNWLPDPNPNGDGSVYVERSIDGVIYDVIDWIGGSSYTDNGTTFFIQPNTQYWYRVIPVSGGVTSTPSNVVTITTGS